MRVCSMLFGLLLAGITIIGARAEPAARPDYVEFAVHDIAKSKAFYGSIFGWSFTDYGSAYCSFNAASISGGFSTDGVPQPGGPLLVLYVADLDGTLARARAAGATVVRPPFAFPGGRRFHFRDPDGYEVAAWSEK
ncbi:MAG TPA: VOC family protein [Rhizomicrobium sp.]|nr:VOC family protein [Rhizomicrobium sp.]